MKTKKRIGVLVLTVVLATAMVLSGCGAKQTQVGDDGERITIRWMGYPISSLNENGYTERLIEETFNVNIEPVQMDSATYRTKKPMMLASDNTIDIIYELDPVDLQNDAKQGYLMELPLDVLKEKAPGLVKTINETEPRAWMYSLYEDTNYGIPNMYYSGMYPQIGQWRMDWLRNVGIDKVPETIDEMHEALYRFTHNDPDGNGENDTYGMSGDLKNWYFTFPEIFGAYGVLPFSWMEEDGKAVYGGTTEGAKEALATLAKWYQEGIIHPDFITDDTNGGAYGERFVNGEIGYMGVGGYSYADLDPSVANSRGYVMQQINPEAEIVPSILPTGPDGESGGFAWGLGGHVIALGKNVEKNPEKLDKILEILEYMNNNQEFSAKMVIGEEGTHYTKNDESIGGIKYIEPYNASKERAKEFGVGAMDASSFFNIIPLTAETRDLYREKKQVEHVNEHVKNNKSLNDLFLKPDVVPGSDRYLGNLLTKQQQVMAKIIRGDVPVSEYDNFIKDWYAGDGKILTDNANETLKTMKEVIDKAK